MFAPAKINLTLHVLGKLPDAYHALHSLVAFADFGDDLTFQEGGNSFTLEIEGTKGLEQNNLILKAAFLLEGKVPYGHFKLIKRIPIAAGLGGGSADAACALRLLTADKDLQSQIAQQIGADVSVCLESKPRFMRGIGHDLGELLSLKFLPALLVNPNIALSTKDVFTALEAPPFQKLKQNEEISDLKAFLIASHNSLEQSAIKLAPLLKPLLLELKSLKGAWLSRLSGSGATCFAVFDTHDEAREAESQLRDKYPSFFVKAVTLNV